MAAAWPAADAPILAGGYTLGQDPDVARTPWDDGMVRQERRYSAALTVRQVTALLADDAALARFRVWARAHAHGWFSWPDDDGVSRQARVRGGAGGIRYVAHVRGGLRHWEARCEIEGRR